MYTPVNPSSFYIKVGFKGVKIMQAHFRDDREGFSESLLGAHAAL